MRKCVLLFVVVLALLPALPVLADGPGDRVVRITFASQEELAQLAKRLDIWEVHHDAGTSGSGYVVAYVSAAESAWLVSEGMSVQTVTTQAHPDTIPGFPCYRTVDELYAQLEAWGATYPLLTDLSSIGSSYEGRPLMMLRLTNEETGLNKPIFFLMANIHGRELITPETAMVYIQRLLEGYGVDADATWLLNEHIIYVLVSANPDGHVRNEEGQPWAYWRKNTHPYGSCSADSYGVDLNRNFEFEWGGDSTDPCAETYQGPSAASEPETQMLENFVRGIFPDQRGPGDDDAAPDSATGLLITLHSYSDLVLWPWGHTTTVAPNGAQLEALGRRLASFNGYTPQQAVGLYPTTGSTDDWSYGELGIASYTFEIGSAGDEFYPPCSRYDALIEPNIDALIYAAKVARTPYITPFGPHTSNVTTTVPSVFVGEPVPMQALIQDSDSYNAGQTVVAAEAYLDVLPWDGGVPYPLTAVDGAFDEPSEMVQGAVGTPGTAHGRHLIYVRGQDANGDWGPISAVFVDLKDSSSVEGTVSDAGSGLPVSGVLVEALSATEVFSAETGPEGDYFISMSPNTYTISAQHRDYAPFSTTVVAAFSQTTVLDIALQRLPWGTLGVELYELGSALPLSGTVEVEGIPMTLEVASTMSLELPVGVYTLTATSEGHSPRQQVISLTAGSWLTAVFRLPPPPPLLVVDDDDGASYETYILPALDASGFLYDVWPVALKGSVSPDLVSSYAGLIWFTGDDALNSVSRYEQTVLEGYLNQGGRLFLTGQNIAMDIKNDYGDFFPDVLAAAFVQDSSGDTVVNGLSFYAGMTVTLAGGDGADNQSSPDVIAPLTTAATPVFNYASGAGVGGLAVEQGAYRLIYLSFGLEGVADLAQRAAILRDGLAWLQTGYPPSRVPMTLGHAGDLVYRSVPMSYTLSVFNDSLMSITDGELSVTFPPDVEVFSDGGTLLLGGLIWSDLSMLSEDSRDFAWSLLVPETYARDVLTCSVTFDWPHLSVPAQVDVYLRVAMPYDVALSPTSSTRPGVPGSEVSHVLTLMNTGSSSSTFDVTMSEYVWPTALGLESVTLEPAASVPLTVTVTVPSDAAWGASDALTVTAVSQAYPMRSAAAVLTTTADAAYALVLSPTSAQGQGVLGADVSYMFNVTNQGNAPVTASLAMQDGTWPSGVVPASLPLSIGGTSLVTVTVSVPSGAIPGDLDVAQLVATFEDASATASITTTAVVSYGVVLRAVPEAGEALPGTTMTYTLRVTNTGNYSDTFDLSANGEVWTTTVASTVGPLGAGESQAVPVVVEVPAGVALGSMDAVTVMAASQSDAAVSASLVLTTTVVDCVSIWGPSMTYLPSQPLAGWPVTFTGAVAGGTPPIMYGWNFGDGTLVEGQVVTHTFTLQSGMLPYQVVMTATNACSLASVQEIITLKAHYIYLPLVMKSTD